MEDAHLGRTGLRVSRLCLGAGTFGYVSGKSFGNLGMTKERSVEMMDLALENGINFFDAADAYGWRVQSRPAHSGGSMTGAMIRTLLLVTV
jgi:NDP-hexose C3-ketoreductase / dTDP-4-oxo-2-deoxy-alpha-D-pentos-2-ene 2,3-reductase